MGQETSQLPHDPAHQLVQRNHDHLVDKSVFGKDQVHKSIDGCSHVGDAPSTPKAPAHDDKENCSPAARSSNRKAPTFCIPAAAPVVKADATAPLSQKIVVPVSTDEAADATTAAIDEAGRARQRAAEIGDYLEARRAATENARAACAIAREQSERAQIEISKQISTASVSCRRGGGIAPVMLEQIHWAVPAACRSAHKQRAPRAGQDVAYIDSLRGPQAPAEPEHFFDGQLEQAWEQPSGCSLLVAPRGQLNTRVGVSEKSVALALKAVDDAASRKSVIVLDL